MILSFAHKGLHLFWASGSHAGIQSQHAARLRNRLAILDSAHTIDDIDKPGLRLHALAGKQGGRWSIAVSGNWRLTFRYEAGNAYGVDYEDYH